MAPIDEATLDTDTPRTMDGREYPRHLRPYSKFDEPLLKVLAANEEATFDEVARAPLDARTVAALPRWLASAQWRGLIAKHSDGSTRRRYTLTQRGRRRLRDLRR